MPQNLQEAFSPWKSTGSERHYLIPMTMVFLLLGRRAGWPAGVM